MPFSHLEATVVSLLAASGNRADASGVVIRLTDALRNVPNSLVCCNSSVIWDGLRQEFYAPPEYHSIRESLRCTVAGDISGYEIRRDLHLIPVHTMEEKE